MTSLRFFGALAVICVVGWLVASRLWEATAQLGKVGEAVDQATAQAVSSHFDKGVEALAAKDYDAAIGWFDRALILDKDHAPSYLHRGVAYDQKKDAAHALADFKEAIRLAPQEAEGYFFRGLYYVGQQDGCRALRDFNEAIRLNPDKAAYFVHRGRVFQARKEFDQALADMNEAIRLEPEGAEGYLGRGTVYEDRKDFERAVADFARAIQLDPKDPGAYNSLAWIYATCPQKPLRNGRQALDYAKFACQLTGWKEAFYFDTLAAAYAECGQFPEAIEWQTKALAAPDAFDEDKDRQEARERLKQYQAHQAFTDHGP